MKQFRNVTIASHILLLAALSTAMPASAATFDGSWNVQITSKNAACPSGSSVAIGYLARRDVFGHLDRTADLNGVR